MTDMRYTAGKHTMLVVREYSSINAYSHSHLGRAWQRCLVEELWASISREEMASMTSLTACRYATLTRNRQFCSLMLVHPKHCSGGMCDICR